MTHTRTGRAPPTIYLPPCSLTLSCHHLSLGEFAGKRARFEKMSALTRWCRMSDQSTEAPNMVSKIKLAKRRLEALKMISAAPLVARMFNRKNSANASIVLSLQFANPAPEFKK